MKSTWFSGAALLWGCLLVLSLGGCGEKSHAQNKGFENDGKKQTGRIQVDASTGGTSSVDAKGGASVMDSGTDQSVKQIDAGKGATGTSSLDAAADSGVQEVKNCGDIACRGHGTCKTAADGTPLCVCDIGYVLEEGECLVDRNCKKIRYLEEDSCRYLVDNRPAVAMFFAVDFCAGTAVLPEDLGDLDEAFQIFENGRDIQENPESVATVVERDVESYVTIALDVSKSVTGVAGDTEKKEALSKLVSHLRNFVAALKAPKGEPPVSVSIIVFGRFVAEYVPFTTNLKAIDKALQALEDDPAEVVKLVGADGTALYQAVQESIRSVERVRKLRSLVTDQGVLTSGTAVIVTDGRDSSNAKLNDSLLESTRVNVISVGISGEIDDEYLTQIGRDGSFLAPSPRDWADAFSEIAERVDQYPDRAYLLAYCSSATSGEPTVSIALKGEEVVQTAACKFDADLFSVDPNLTCDLAFFETMCTDAGLECGGMLACGGCGSDSCCAAGSCSQPAAFGGDCRGDDELCQAEGKLCEVGPDADGSSDTELCFAPAGLGEECSDAVKCEPGVGYCNTEGDPPTCISVFPEGDQCGSARAHAGDRCETLNCAKTNPDSPSDPFICQPPARIFDACSGSSAGAACEPGSYCSSNVCTARSTRSCTRDVECRSGVCDPDVKLCGETGVCYWDWDSVVAP